MEVDLKKEKGFEKSDLTSDEVGQLMRVMKKAQEFEVREEQLLMRQPLEGQLNKYTNVVKGWQHRWFVLNTDQGRLDYFEKEEHKRLLKPSRGSIILAGAVVCPSDEDSQTFIINAVNGEVFRLKASDARERQHWVNRLRATAEFQSELMSFGKAPPDPCHDNNPNNNNSNNNNTDKTPKTDLNRTSSRPSSLHKPYNNNKIHSNTHNNIHSCSQQLNNVNKLSQRLHSLIEMSSGSCVSSLDQDLLLLKASSRSAILCLQQCLSVLTDQALTQPITSSLQRELISSRELGETLTNRSLFDLSLHHPPYSPLIQELERQQLRQRYRDTQQDKDTDMDTNVDALSLDEHKPVILDLLSQLKLGMDLTKVVLPTFILEKRSLLEMFADCMAHPETFLRIGDEESGEGRMVRLLEWYLTSFHAARQGSVARKPYNPIIGESFHCEWWCGGREMGDEGGGGSGGSGRLFYCAEQVSHHPPISAFYFEAPEKGISMEASIWTKSKFMGMSVGVVMVGKIRLRLHKHRGSRQKSDKEAGKESDKETGRDTENETEEYILSLPSAYARSILTTPWMELGDKITITCPSTQCSAGLIFHTKPFYGGRLHRVSGEVKGPTGENVCHVTGEWNNTLEFTFPNGSSKSIDTTTLPINQKRTTPIHNQQPQESRRLWHHVTQHLRKGDVETATHYKHLLEEEQRKLERLRKQTQIPMQPKYFEETQDGWHFKFPLVTSSDNSSFTSAFM